MGRNRIAREFYLMFSIAALAVIAACATAQQPAVGAPPGAGVTTVYLVRHAEKSTAVPSDPDPDITAAGERRAEALATRLGASGVTAIIATQFKRTQETAQPLAAEAGVIPEIVPAGGRSHADSVAAAVMRHRGSRILVVGHSNTLAGIIAALGGPRLPNLCDSQYSDLFVMYIPVSGRVELTRQHYGARDPAPDPACQEMQAQ
jgi:phosphohistidine phosphatase SixA